MLNVLGIYNRHLLDKLPAELNCITRKSAISAFLPSSSLDHCLYVMLIAYVVEFGCVKNENLGCLTVCFGLVYMYQRVSGKFSLSDSHILLGNKLGVRI